MSGELLASGQQRHSAGRGLPVYVPGQRKRRLVRWLLILSIGALLFWYAWPWPLPFAEDYLANVQQVALADLNGNGYLDIFGAGCCGRKAPTDGPLRSPHRLPYSLVWLNQGDGRLLPANQRIGQAGSNAAALADLNGNGRLDVFLANGRTMDRDANYHTLTPNTVWFNDGRSHFSDSGQQLGAAESLTVALGDLTGNGFPDAVVGNRGPDEVWFNDGSGHFGDSGQRLGDALTRSVFLSDLNGNGHLDLFVAGQRGGQVWFNDGAGRFQPGSQRIRYYSWETAALGDLNDDGYADILVVGPARYRVWRNSGDGHFRADFYRRYR